jgi:predicted membrane protein
MGQLSNSSMLLRKIILSIISEATLLSVTQMEVNKIKAMPVRQLSRSVHCVVIGRWRAQSSVMMVILEEVTDVINTVKSNTKFSLYAEMVSLKVAKNVTTGIVIITIHVQIFVLPQPVGMVSEKVMNNVMMVT